MELVKLDDFALRHFDKKFGGTKILDFSPEQFIEKVQEIFNNSSINLTEEGYYYDSPLENINNIKDSDIEYVIHEGYAPFCKLVAIRNFTNARVGSMKITLENYQYLRSGYSSRNDDELPVFSRWLELPIPAPKAEWLILVLYNKEQIDKENKIKVERGFSKEFIPFDAEWGIVAILGQDNYDEEPMKPETMIRNSFLHGGSGVEFDNDKYLKSVVFWQNHATIK